MDCIAFYNVAEELVGCSALQASQNMQIEPDNQPPALKTAIGKKRIFHIGMSKGASSKNPIRYVLKRCFITDDEATNALQGAIKETPLSQVRKHISS
jgi:replication factor A1